MENAIIAHNSLLRLSSNTSNWFPVNRHLGFRDIRVLESPRKSSQRFSVRFSDPGHQLYYAWPRGETKKGQKKKGSEIESVKKKLKFIKRLSSDLSLSSLEASDKESGNSLMNEDKVSKAVQVIQAQLQELRLEQKELKRNMKKQKAHIKSTLKQTKSKHICESSSSSSSESSDGENGEAFDLIRLRSNVYKQSIGNESPNAVKELKIAKIGSLIQQEKSEEELTIGEVRSRNSIEECCSKGGAECGSWNGCSNEQSNSIVEETSTKRIEVCIGGNCKKLGAGALLEEFERKAGAECVVSACNCMGKCKNGPNLRVSCSPDGDPAARPSIKSLCIGVGLQDVDMILADLLSKDATNECLMVPC